jgi:predicted glycosyltransferase
MTRTLIYSHDTYGLGHLRRCTLLAGGIVGADADNEVVIVTGSPRAQAFPLPDRVDTIKLPAATKDDDGGYRARRLRCDLDDLVRLRSELLLAAVNSFEPDVVLVDHAPIGMAGELVPMLHRFARSRWAPRLVLGLRDIIDEAARVEHCWDADGSWDLLGAYDEILVYGDADITTTATELGLGRRVPAPVRHTGYIAPTMPEAVGGDPFVMVTAGGGGDGHELLRRYLDAVECGALDGIQSVVVTGPLMSAGRRAELITRAERTRVSPCSQFAEDMRSLIASATAVVSMAGYNTVVEELAAATPAPARAPLGAPPRTGHPGPTPRARQRRRTLPVDELDRPHASAASSSGRAPAMPGGPWSISAALRRAPPDRPRAPQGADSRPDGTCPPPTEPERNRCHV